MPPRPGLSGPAEAAARTWQAGVGLQAEKTPSPSCWNRRGSLLESWSHVSALTNTSQAAWSPVCAGESRSRNRTSSFGFSAQGPLSHPPLESSLFFTSLSCCLHVTEPHRPCPIFPLTAPGPVPVPQVNRIPTPKAEMDNVDFPVIWGFVRWQEAWCPVPAPSPESFCLQRLHRPLLSLQPFFLPFSLSIVAPASSPTFSQNQHVKPQHPYPNRGYQLFTQHPLGGFGLSPTLSCPGNVVVSSKKKKCVCYLLVS